MAGATQPRTIVLGAGIGGLATAIRLGAQGHRVTVLERAARPGGKMREVEVAGRTFGCGPSVLTLPWVLDELCATAGVRRADLIRLTPLAPVCRHFFADGTQVDLYADEPIAPGAPPESAWARAADELQKTLGGRAGAQYLRFRAHAARIYEFVRRPFMQSPLPKSPLGLLRMHPLRDFMGLFHLDAGRTLWQALGSFFDDPRLRVLFARYATYSGGDPFQAPATLAVIPHCELAFGVHHVEGGMYRVAEALTELVTRTGGTVRCGADVERIELDPREGRALAVHVGGERLAADFVVANCDVAQLYGRLLRGSRRAERDGPAVQAMPPSLSAYLHLVAAGDAAELPLLHHNVFFSADYPREFAELASGPPTDPTIYLCSPDALFRRADQRWFFLTNAPALPPGSEHSDAAWSPAQIAACRARVAGKLARHGMDLGRHSRGSFDVTPRDFAERFPWSRGAIYGAAANSRLGSFRRPPNRVPGIGNLYCVGGSTHPGAGVPMVMLSAQIVAGLVGGGT